MTRKRYSIKQVFIGIKSNPSIELYARKGSLNFHSNKECPMLNNGQFEHYQYKQISIQEVEQKELNPDICVYKTLGMN